MRELLEHLGIPNTLLAAILFSFTFIVGNITGWIAKEKTSEHL